ncbi:MBL fold metallo-hydrolase [Candidatus Aenigmatarchaeota archaeon]
MKIRVLGSGGWEGTPGPFAKDKISKMAWENPDKKEFRFRPCFEIENKNKSFLVEIPPDIRLISQKFNLPKINDFLVSHWHFDHMYGLLELDSWAYRNPITIHCSQKTNDWLEKNFAHIKKEINVLKPLKEVKINGVEIIPFPIYHMSRFDKDLKEEELENTFGFVFDKKIAYMADFYKIPEISKKFLKNIDVLITDGTFLFEKEMPKEHPYLKRCDGRMFADPDHLHDDDIFKVIEEINPKKVVFHSISNILWKTHDEFQKMLPENMFASYDGMIID